jgi:hypothetical protein
MIVLLLLIQAAICARILHRELALRRFRNFASSIFYSVYFFLYIFVPLVLHIFFDGARSIIAGNTELFRDDTVYLVFNLIGIALLSSGLVIGARADAGAVAPIRHEIDFNGTRVANMIGLLIVLGLVLFVYSTGSSVAELLVASRFSWMEGDSFNSGFIVISTYLIALTPVYAYLVGIKVPYNKLILAAALAALLLYAAITKDRKWLFYILSGWLAAKFHQRKGSLGVSAGGLTAAFLLFMLIILSQFLRDMVPRYLMGEDVEFFDGIGAWLAHLFEYSDLSYFYRATIEAIDQNINQGFYIFLGLARRVVFLFVPAGYSGGLKIEDMSAIFSDQVHGEDLVRRGSMPPGLFGSFVLSFGWAVTVLLMPLFAWALGKLDQLFRSAKSPVHIALITLFLTSVVFGFRGDESTAFYFAAVNIMMMAALAYASRVRFW